MDIKGSDAAHNSDARDLTNNRLEKQSSTPNDLPDSDQDKEKLKNEEIIMDLPEVSDIPGQENIEPLPFGELADTTIASDDEEGVDVFDDDDDDEDINEDGSIEMIAGTEGDVNPSERHALEDDTYLPTADENNLRRATMDNTDFQGEPLNEESFGDVESGSGLDVPGSQDETRTSSMGQGDEENKNYSLGSADNDNVVEGTP
jgi:hypothetical protein